MRVARDRHCSGNAYGAVRRVFEYERDDASLLGKDDAGLWERGMRGFRNSAGV